MDVDQLKKRRFKVGKITANPFFNFLRDIRKTATGKSLQELTAQGAALWRRMSHNEKQPYRNLAQQATRGRRRPKRGRKPKRSRAGFSPSKAKSASFDNQAGHS